MDTDMTSHSALDPFYHGTKANLKVGDLISVGHPSNFGDNTPLSWVYFSQTLEAAMWGAELATGTGRQRIFIIEPTGPFMDDPNLTDKKFPGNPTKSFRSRDPLLIIGEISDWQGHTQEQLQRMKEGLSALRAAGKDIIID